MNTSLAARIGSRLSSQGRKLKRVLHIPTHYSYDGFTILLPAEHRLPEYQRRHPRYDRFLPHLAEALGADVAIIDVGANCGDSLAAMVERNPRATYVCIEADPGFFRLLEANIARMKAAVGELSVYPIRSLAGNSTGLVALAGAGGTRHAVPGAGGLASAALDSIVDALPPLAVRLLKSDVDGFDYDVLDSAERLLATQRPLLFFEAQCDDQDQLAGFIRTISSLADRGYRHWTAFDNFGEVILRGVDKAAVLQLLHYVWRQNRGQSTRTIYYLDLLAATDADGAFIAGVVESY